MHLLNHFSYSLYEPNDSRVLMEYKGVLEKAICQGSQLQLEPRGHLKSPQVDESRQGDNERCLHAYACIGVHKHSM